MDYSSGQAPMVSLPACGPCDPIDISDVMGYLPATSPVPVADSFMNSQATVDRAEYGAFDPWSRDLAREGAYPGGSEYGAAQAASSVSEEATVGLHQGMVAVPVAGLTPGERPGMRAETSRADDERGQEGGS